MPEAKVLVVYYSRTGITRSLASALAQTLAADLEEICDCSDREGPGGYLRSLFDALRKRHVEIVPAGLDVSAYDLVVVGSPVWAGSVSAPVRSYLIENRARLPQVAFFCSFGGRGADNAVHEMQEIVGKPAVAECKVTASEVHHGAHTALAAFVSGLKRHIAKSGNLEWAC
ncbi:flavodoxin family protein [Paraburkholderia bryophila]|uniref:Menaquinone-dependent protoporphyrinogen IX oxidase n=1 Tax=Paraburkholderia bryophila TaxID=420952 RepID=A0A7Z0AYX3_9BURK|nr:flavodoxin [Paraburkholderia bryophila]NYH14178.1 menaquinone-dependent protoporphyrinogen IX oxidase [Paraburkholderia bryophila]